MSIHPIQVLTLYVIFIWSMWFIVLTYGEFFDRYIKIFRPILMVLVIPILIYQYIKEFLIKGFGL